MCSESSRQEAQLEGEGQTGGCHVFFLFFWRGGGGVVKMVEIGRAHV